MRSYGGAYKSNDFLKNIITWDDFLVEGKHKNSYDLPDYNNYAFATNNDCAVKISATDRRYFVLDCNNKHAGDKVYFKRITDQLESKETAIHFFHWLARREISEWRLSSIPETAFKKQLKMNLVPGPIQMLIEIYTGEYTQVAWTQVFGEDWLKVTSQMLYENYATWSESRGFRSWDQLNSRAFNVEIKKIVELKVVKEKHPWH